MVICKKDPSFYKTLSNFFINLPDGIPGVWIGKLKGGKKIERCYGPDFFEYVLRKSANLKINHYFCGGNEGVANELKIVCQKRFANQNVVGTYCPPFRELSSQEWEWLANDIIEKEAHIVWIGISTPKQERFAEHLSKLTNTYFIITVGAAFDFHIGKVRQAPKFMQKNGLEWLFRLIMEPKRLWKRYFSIVPLFIYYNIKNLFLLK